MYVVVPNDPSDTFMSSLPHVWRVTCCGHLDILRTDVDLPLGPVNAFVHWHSGFLPFQFVTQSYCHYLKQEKRKRTLRSEESSYNATHLRTQPIVNLSYVRYDKWKIITDLWSSISLISDTGSLNWTTNGVGSAMKENYFFPLNGGGENISHLSVINIFIWFSWQRRIKM